MFNRTRQIEDLLEKNKANPPSFTIHLHSDYWSLNNGSKFLYNNQIASLLDDIRAHKIPVDFLDLFDTANVPFYHGCMIVELLDYRPEKRKDGPLITPNKTRTVLHPDSETLWTDICLLNRKHGGKWTDHEALEVEAKLLLTTSEPLCLDPDPHLTRIANHVARVSTPNAPASLKRKAAALDMEEDEADKVRRAKIIQFMNPRQNRTITYNYKILDLLERRKQQGLSSSASAAPPQVQPSAANLGTSRAAPPPYINVPRPPSAVVVQPTVVSAPDNPHPSNGTHPPENGRNTPRAASTRAPTPKQHMPSTQVNGINGVNGVNGAHSPPPRATGTPVQFPPPPTQPPHRPSPSPIPSAHSPPAVHSAVKQAPVPPNVNRIGTPTHQHQAYNLHPTANARSPVPPQPAHPPHQAPPGGYPGQNFLQTPPANRPKQVPTPNGSQPSTQQHPQQTMLYSQQMVQQLHQQANVLLQHQRMQQNPNVARAGTPGTPQPGPRPTPAMQTQQQQLAARGMGMPQQQMMAHAAYYQHYNHLRAFQPGQGAVGQPQQPQHASQHSGVAPTADPQQQQQQQQQAQLQQQQRAVAAAAAYQYYPQAYSQTNQQARSGQPGQYWTAMQVNQRVMPGMPNGQPIPAMQAAMAQQHGQQLHVGTAPPAQGNVQGR